MSGLTAAQVPEIVMTGGSCRIDADVAPRFKVGDAVVARVINPTGHTRLPRYVRGRAGEIVKDYGVFVFPDVSAHRRPEKPQHVYSVRFAARELWGEDAHPRDALFVDMWDDYLDPR